MKKLLLVSVLLGIGFVAGMSWKDLIAHGVGGGDVPVGNGDVNADGEIDISDVVYLVNALFLNGPALIAIECPSPSGKRLPVTGQTVCYDQSGGIIDCASATCPGQDGRYSTGCSSVGRFDDNGDGTVTDTCTGLMWQKDTADVNGDGQIVDDQISDHGDAVPWCDALVYCESLDFAGHDDWRLPNVRELQSIVDYGRFNPAVDPVFGAMSHGYWSSSSRLNGPTFAWYVGFVEGDVFGFGGTVNKDYHFYVRAVRDGR